MNGRLVTGKGAYADKSIFLPAAGFGRDSDLDYAGSGGNYWSSTLDSDHSGYTWDLYSGYAWDLDFAGSFYESYYARFGGQSVRPLRDPAK